MKKYYLFVWAAALFVLLIVACSPKDNDATSDSQDAQVYAIEPADEAIYKLAKQYFQPLPESVEKAENPSNEDKVALGRMLFHDTRLSKSNTFSCNSCHNLATFGVDNNPVSIGHGWKTGSRNSPTVFNAAAHFVQFWDGRAADVEEQAKGPVLNPVEMGSPHAEFVVDRIKHIPDYQKLFAAAFPNDAEPLTYDNMANAIGAFERKLLTPSRFDRFLQGDGSALTTEEKAGIKSFVDAGCTTCHLGANLGGNMYQKFGLANGPYWKFTGSATEDEGRFDVTQKEPDKYVFKVPGLRNITRTYPYFHDGSVWDLNEAVKIMAKTQLNRDLSDQETKSIVVFLQSLEGEIPAMALTLPVLPPATYGTVKPDLN